MLHRFPGHVEPTGQPAKGRPDVHDWATFALSRGTTADSDELREALVKRLNDPDLDTRAEAIHGLATRGDPRATPPLLDALATPREDSDQHLIEEALYALAATTGDQRLCAYVVVHRDGWLAAGDALPEDLQSAYTRCTTRPTTSP